jgi:hypothetical protein
MADEQKPRRWPFVVILGLGAWNLWLTSQLEEVRSVASAADWKATSALNKTTELEAEIEEPRRR